MQATKVKFLGKKETKKLERIIERNYGVKLELGELTILKTAENKVWISSPEISKLPLDKLRINSIGLYFGRLEGEKIRLSVEGCQLVGNLATKSLAILNQSEAKQFLRGLNIRPKKLVNCEEENFVLVRHGDDFLGCGKFSSGKIENLLPRARRAGNGLL